MKRTESIKKKRKKTSKNCSEFLSQPFDFARKVKAPKPKGEMKSSKEEVECHLHKAHSEEKSEERECADDLHEYSDPQVKFKDNLPVYGDFNKRLIRKRSTLHQAQMVCHTWFTNNVQELQDSSFLT